MDKYLINGGKVLSGEIEISGSKNASLPLLFASILSDEKITINNVPDLKDIQTCCSLLEVLGVSVIREGSTIHLCGKELNSYEAPYELVSTMRASVLVMGPLLARIGKAKVSLPGGCSLGARPINLHLDFFRTLGAKVNLIHGYVEIECGNMNGTDYHFDQKTVTGTMNALFLAVLTPGTTIMHNCALEPEVVELCLLLKSMGANIRGEGSETIIVQGVSILHGTEYRVIPDRIECGTIMIAAAITYGKIRLKSCNPKHMTALMRKLITAGVDIEYDHEGRTISIDAKNKYNGTSISTQPYPGFPTDLQAQYMALMSLANGTTIITENIFENRFMHVSELKRMGANLIIQGNTVVVTGVEYLSGAKVMATDIRAGAGLILAALRAKGETEISRIYHVERGYEHIEKKLSSLGASIRRVIE
ncbi:MAG: UDP-N-acetylglucosamine 1-carboxyvinyltransferase [Bdellovibrionales bacterium RIFOXYB2_FULL_36_6]|nr:MAG: UDP-N-acetylglucosamine 1-carboxyvinyltransferase [Bdellovibrionales bacterium RIFOXYB2_FULL_36_6]